MDRPDIEWFALISAWEWLEYRLDRPKLGVAWVGGIDRADISCGTVARGGLKELPGELDPCEDCVARSGRSRDRDLFKRSLLVFGGFL